MNTHRRKLLKTIGLAATAVQLPYLTLSTPVTAKSPSQQMLFDGNARGLEGCSAIECSEGSSSCSDG